MEPFIIMFDYVNVTKIQNGRHGTHELPKDGALPSHGFVFRDT